MFHGANLSRRAGERYGVFTLPEVSESNLGEHGVRAGCSFQASEFWWRRDGFEPLRRGGIKICDPIAMCGLFPEGAGLCPLVEK